MKKAFLFFLLVSFCGLALASPFAMAFAGERGDCIAAAVQGGTCPVANNVLGVISFHLDAAKYFSSATVSAVGDLVFAAAALILFFLSILSADRRKGAKNGGGLRRLFWHARKNILSAFTGKIHFAQSLLEHSPVAAV